MIVKAGDTLYGIAWRHGVDYRELAKLNGVGSDWRIEVGQRLQLPHAATAKEPPRPAVANGATSARAPDANRTERVEAPPRLEWPVPPRHPAVLTKPGGGLGITIDGESGQSVTAAASGRVVYAGNGLMRSYGSLIIIKHSENWLTAYGYNQRLVVKEGDEVSAHQTIALMGANGQGVPQLYFEIRRSGRPVNPLEWLPTP